MLEKDALKYHSYPKPGKLSVVPTKAMISQNDLSLAYSPGVGHVCKAIEANEACVYDYTSKSNLVAVITNGTAVLGFGNIGPSAAKPVMEGKGALFKRFANVDVFDIEMNELNADKLIDAVAAMAPTFGGINLEDIASPDCFYIEKELQKRLSIPVFHDDQHGTAIIAAAALTNALFLVNKKIEDVKIVCSGAGAAALACLDMFVDLGANIEHIFVFDRSGLIHKNRDGIEKDIYKFKYAQASEASSLQETMIGADVFLGLSTKNVLTGEDVKNMAVSPIILAMANPEPEILPEVARAARSDAIIATGRSDYPNQVNNVLCFPYIFRGALDVQASCINKEMRLACIHAVANLARKESSSDFVRTAYINEKMAFGKEYIIPKPFDNRLLTEVAPAVAKAAMDSGVARKPITDFKEYVHQLESYIYKSGHIMRPVFDAITGQKLKVLFSDGLEDRVLFAAQQAVEDDLFVPVFLGNETAILSKIRQLGLSLVQGKDFEIVEEEQTEHLCQAAELLKAGKADVLLYGPSEEYANKIEEFEHLIGVEDNVLRATALEILMAPQQTLFVSDSYVVDNPTVEELVNATSLCIDMMDHLKFPAKVGLISSCHSEKMTEAEAKVRELRPDISILGDVTADVALLSNVRAFSKRSDFKEDINLLIAPSKEAAHMAVNVSRALSGAVKIGPLILGLKKTAYVIPENITTRGILNMASIGASCVLSKR